MALTDREMTSTTHGTFMPTIWADDTRDAIEFLEVLSKLVNVSYESEMSIGRTLQIPLRANYNTQTKTEGLANTVVFQSQLGTTGATSNYQSITISTMQYAAALLNEVVKAQSKYDERQRIAHGLGYALMRGVEVAIGALFGSFSQITGALGSEPDDAVLRRSWQYLADVGVTSEAAWVFGPGAVAALFGNDKFTSRDFVDVKSVIETAKLPPLYSFPSYSSNLLTAPATGQTNCTLMHREAIIMIRQIKPTFKEQYLIRNLADGVVAFDLYNVSEALWVAEAPAGDADPTTGDYGAVLIRTN